ncbi:adenosinetriphosphatase [Fonticula alba]|uniref:Chromatin-remodeling ATPase INO80 n=1 Tax=Fonticula alba TaxID=691883 RepID=A0A058Z918_FONAL|nr:adenosinetriphosphatase [Fonticula alba]KCV69987.1 adenosinetriphosphatase [Fonticula alba]|eukprot:XP_009495593.1 adenosinetriphosphatase [Fonticula alba]
MAATYAPGFFCRPSWPPVRSTPSSLAGSPLSSAGGLFGPPSASSGSPLGAAGAGSLLTSALSFLSTKTRPTGGAPASASPSPQPPAPVRAQAPSSQSSGGPGPGAPGAFSPGPSPAASPAPGPPVADALSTAVRLRSQRAMRARAVTFNLVFDAEGDLAADRGWAILASGDSGSAGPGPGSGIGGSARPLLASRLRTAKASQALLVDQLLEQHLNHRQADRETGWLRAVTTLAEVQRHTAGAPGDPLGAPFSYGMSVRPGLPRDSFELFTHWPVGYREDVWLDVATEALADPLLAVMAQASRPLGRHYAPTAADGPPEHMLTAGYRPACALSSQRYVIRRLARARELRRASLAADRLFMASHRPAFETVITEALSQRRAARSRPLVLRPGLLPSEAGFLTRGTGPRPAGPGQPAPRTLFCDMADGVAVAASRRTAELESDDDWAEYDRLLAAARAPGPGGAGPAGPAGPAALPAPGPRPGTEQEATPELAPGEDTSAASGTASAGTTSAPAAGPASTDEPPAPISFSLAGDLSDSELVLGSVDLFGSDLEEGSAASSVSSGSESDGPGDKRPRPGGASSLAGPADPTARPAKKPKSSASGAAAAGASGGVSASGPGSAKRLKDSAGAAGGGPGGRVIRDAFAVLKSATQGTGAGGPAVSASSSSLERSPSPDPNDPEQMAAIERRRAERQWSAFVRNDVLRAARVHSSSHLHRRLNARRVALVCVREVRRTGFSSGSSLSLGLPAPLLAGVSQVDPAPAAISSAAAAAAAGGGLLPVSLAAGSPLVGVATGVAPRRGRTLVTTSRRLARDVLAHWRRHEREEREARRRYEREEAERLRLEEEAREERRQRNKLNFLITQTELYAHFIQRKSTKVAEAGATPGPDASDAPSPALGGVDIESMDFSTMDESDLQRAAAQGAMSHVAAHHSRVRAFDSTSGRVAGAGAGAAAAAAGGSNAQEQFDQLGFDLTAPSTLTEAPSVTQPKMLTCRLKSYQLKGLSWLYNLHEQGINGILADEMGLGKTVQSISVLAHLAEKHQVWGPFIVVTPATTLHNWTNELHNFCPDFRVLPYWGDRGDRATLRRYWQGVGQDPSGPRRRGVFSGIDVLGRRDSPFHVIVTSYQIAVMDEQFLRPIRWEYMILDEAQAVKSSTSLRWNTLLKFNCRNRLLLTGTPIQNSMQELWALLHFIMPLMFDSHKEFSEWFSKDIEGNAGERGDSVNAHQLARLHMILKPFMLRRVKRDVENELGEKIMVDRYCVMTPRQRRLYQGLQDKLSISDLLQSSSSLSAAQSAFNDDDSGLNPTAGGSGSGANYLLNLVMQCRKVSCHPDLLDSREESEPYRMIPLPRQYAIDLAPGPMPPGLVVDFGLPAPPVSGPISLALPGCVLVSGDAGQLVAGGIGPAFGGQYADAPPSSGPLCPYRSPTQQDAMDSLPPGHIRPGHLIVSRGFFLRSPRTLANVAAPAVCIWSPPAPEAAGRAAYLTAGVGSLARLSGGYSPAEVQRLAESSLFERFLHLLATHEERATLAWYHEHQASPMATHTASPDGAPSSDALLVLETSQADHLMADAETMDGAPAGEAPALPRHLLSMLNVTGAAEATRTGPRTAGLSERAITSSPALAALCSVSADLLHQEYTYHGRFEGLYQPAAAVCAVVPAIRQPGRAADLEPDRRRALGACLGLDAALAASMPPTRPHAAALSRAVVVHPGGPAEGLSAATGGLAATGGHFRRGAPVSPAGPASAWFSLARLPPGALQQPDNGPLPGSEAAAQAHYRAVATDCLGLDQHAADAWASPGARGLATGGLIGDRRRAFGPTQSLSFVQCPSVEDLIHDSGKLRLLDQLLAELYAGRHRVLIFCQLVTMIDLLERFMVFRGYRFFRLDGSTRIEDRRDMVSEFQTNDDIFAFLISTRAGNSGINLTAADTVIFYESDWNPTVDQQAMDRVHRLGQTKQVTVYRLITRDTIEERILLSAGQKHEIQKVVIQGGDFQMDHMPGPPTDTEGTGAEAPAA